MKTMEDLDEADSVEMGSGYIMCLVEDDPQDSKISSDRKLFGLVVSKFHNCLRVPQGPQVYLNF